VEQVAADQVAQAVVVYLRGVRGAMVVPDAADSGLDSPRISGASQPSSSEQSR